VTIALVVGIGVACGLLGTCLARKLAHRVGFLDNPDGRRKVQKTPVALGGGLGVFFGITVSLVLCSSISPEVAQGLLQKPQQGIALLLATGLVGLVGLLDDLIDLRARHKLFGQFLAIAILIGIGGYRIEILSLLGYQLQLGPLSIIVTAFWFIATINAVNLLDGMDGLLGTVGLVALLAISWMAFATGNMMAGWVSLAAAGSIVGFLYFNLPPASIYLGDCGSLLIGLLLASLSMDSCLKGPTTAIVAPAVLLVLPIMDTSAAVVRRKLTGRGLATSDRGHLHHELLRHGLNRVRVLLLVGTLAIIAAAGALITTFFQNDVFAFIAGGAVIMILLTSGLFGVAEFRLIRHRLIGMIQSVGGQAVEVSVRLQGQVDWANSWHELLQRAESLQLITAILDVNDPARQEGFHGRWDRRAETDHFWRLELALRYQNKVIGKLTVLGQGDTPSPDHLNWIREVQEELENLGVRKESTVAIIETPESRVLPQAAIGL
jgi:UDP-GlcNAc:undecaprenyl-phosphate/decaprenyl-phosphate GlcNAc-1-phosphate transferase